MVFFLKSRFKDLSNTVMFSTGFPTHRTREGEGQTQDHTYIKKTLARMRNTEKTRKAIPL
jgi:hypothetical protein